MRSGILVILYIALAVTRTGFAQPSAREIVRNRTSPQGAASPDLAAETGWRTVRGYAYKVLLRQPDGTFAPADPRQTFTTGQSFRLEIEPHNDLWIYILNRGPTGTEQLLLPERGEEHLLLRRGERATVPTDGYFTFADPPGTELFRIVASPDKLPWANPEALFKLESGEQLAAGEARDAREQAETRSKSLEQIGREQGRMASFGEPLDRVIAQCTTNPAFRGRAKDTIVAAPPVEGEDGSETEVVRASPEADNRDPFIHDVRLDHQRP